MRSWNAMQNKFESFVISRYIIVQISYEGSSVSGFPIFGSGSQLVSEYTLEVYLPDM